MHDDASTEKKILKLKGFFFCNSPLAGNKVNLYTSYSDA